MLDYALRHVAALATPKGKYDAERLFEEEFPTKYGLFQQTMTITSMLIIQSFSNTAK